MNKKVRIFEVGPRDGLQNEKTILSLKIKLDYITALALTGLKDIEVGAFVREDKVPQMAHSKEIFKKIPKLNLGRNGNINFWGLVPNEKGLERALAAGCRAVSVFTGSTDTFTRKNIGMTVKESLKVFERVVTLAKKENLKIRGYLSTVWGCPYEGKVNPKKPIQLTSALLNMGVEQVSLGDTIGVATPIEVANLLTQLIPFVKQDKIAGHFHDTHGSALANCLAALLVGVSTLDSSSAGLGGCNYAPGAAGNVSTEDLLYMLDGMKIKTNIDIDALCKASKIALKGLGCKPASRHLTAIG